MKLHTSSIKLQHMEELWRVDYLGKEGLWMDKIARGSGRYHQLSIQ